MRTKVSHACTNCQQRKAKCTGFVPCTNCTRQSLECVIVRAPRKRKPKVNQSDAITSCLNRIENTLLQLLVAESAGRRSAICHSPHSPQSNPADAEIKMLPAFVDNDVQATTTFVDAGGSTCAVAQAIPSPCIYASADCDTNREHYSVCDACRSRFKLAPICTPIPTPQSEFIDAFPSPPPPRFVSPTCVLLDKRKHPAPLDPSFTDL